MKGTIEQAWANRLKIWRAAIRLKHSIEADNELNASVDAERKRFFKAAQQGQLLPPTDIKKIVDGK